MEKLRGDIQNIRIPCDHPLNATQTIQMMTITAMTIPTMTPMLILPERGKERGQALFLLTHFNASYIQPSCFIVGRLEYDCDSNIEMNTSVYI